MRTLARWILTVEPLLLCAAALIFWSPDPRRVWALALFVPVLAARLLVHRRVWTQTPLVWVWVLFIGLCALNIVVAGADVQADGADHTLPLTRGWLMLGRPLFGMMVALSLLEMVRTHGGTGRATWTLTLTACLIAVLALGASSWSEKSALFQPVVDALPRLPELPIIEGGFNVNEIGGALTFVLPPMAALALRDGARWRRRLAAAAFWVGLAALFLGQSRMALGGVIIGLALVAWLLIPAGRGRRLALGGLALLAAFEVALVAGIIGAPQVGLSSRDESSWGARLLIYDSALAITRDYPLTGAGLNMFRNGRVRVLYPVPGYETMVLPHAHNDWLQIASDLGIPGVLTFALWQALLAWAAWETWRRGDAGARLIAVACAGGLLAHRIFGLADAVPLWDRFAFVGYIVTGLLLGQHWLITHPQQDRVMLEQNPDKAGMLWQKTRATSSDG